MLILAGTTRRSPPLCDATINTNSSRNLLSNCRTQLRGDVPKVDEVLTGVTPGIYVAQTGNHHQSAAVGLPARITDREYISLPVPYRLGTCKSASFWSGGEGIRTPDLRRANATRRIRDRPFTVGMCCKYAHFGRRHRIVGSPNPVGYCPGWCQVDVKTRLQTWWDVETLRASRIGLQSMKSGGEPHWLTRSAKRAVYSRTILAR